ncbi:MAG: C39 family peptidase, partial [Deltaproteobacteria bacterium]|nr:C39 family peptidase [Deltaproteobacteria bacterium]
MRFGGTITRDLVIEDLDPRLRGVESLGEQGLLHAADAAIGRLGPRERLAGAEARCLDAWIREHLGDGLSARRDFLRIAAAYPGHPTAWHHHTLVLLSERGPVDALLALEARGPLAPSTDERVAKLLALRARLLAYVLDHGAADRALERCEPELIGRERWLLLRATLRERRGRREEALELILPALGGDSPRWVLGGYAAALLEGLARRDEALELLGRAEASLEAPHLTSHRASLEHELELFDAEALSLDRLERLLSRRDARAVRALTLRRAENAYRRGDVSAARVLWRAGCSRDPDLAERLRAHEGPVVRVQLDVPALLQDPMSCAPTSLAMLSTYFGHPVDHVEVADQICYEGTASHSERGWVEGRGWISREFTVTFDTARALVERGVPFLLVTVAVASAHAQVVVGIDVSRRTLIVRDPSTFRVVELDADPLFERHAAYGPRGHVMLPPDRAGLLDGLELRDVALHDAAHRLRVALEQHDPPEASRLAAELCACAPDHPLALAASRSLAAYEQDPYAVRAACEASLAAFPDDVNAELSLVDCLGTIGTQAEQTEIIERRLAREDPPWIFHERLAAILAEDAAHFERALRLARRAQRAVPMRGRTLALVASIDRNLGHLERALLESRLAATLEPTDDSLAWSYFQEAYRGGQADDALELLRARAEEYRPRSTSPSQVLFQALEWLDRIDEGFNVLEVALEARPEEVDGLLYAAQAHARYGRADLAQELLGRARRAGGGVAVEQCAATLAELASDLPAALEGHLAVLRDQPLSLASHRAVASLMNELQGPARAREHLDRACAQNPTHRGLRELYVTWLRGHDPEAVLPEVERLLGVQPDHAWARRERALVLSELGEHDAAVAEACAAEAMAPRLASSHRVASEVLAAAGQRARALDHARRAVELAPDLPGTVTGALRLASSLDEQLELLESLRQLTFERSVDGQGILEWHEFAIGLRSDPKLLEDAAHLAATRPDLWACWLLHGRSALRVGDAGCARAVLERAVSRFPYLPALHTELSLACRAAGDLQAATRAAAHAAALAPSWLPAIFRATEALTEVGEDAEAAKVLDRGLAHHPRSTPLMTARAEAWWNSGDVGKAIDEIRLAVTAAPESSHAWAAYFRFATALGTSKEVIEHARRIAKERPWNPDVWVQLAEILRRSSENLASLDALAEALERRPGLPEALDVYALTLTRIGRKEAALAACDRPVASYHARGALRARKAWVHWVFGAQEAALEAMRATLRDHPDQVWGRQILIEWEMERGEATAALEEARALVA